MSKQLSATELADLTGKSRSKVREALVGAGLASTPGPRSTRLFDSAEALRVLFGGTDALNPAQEQARLNAAKADLAEIELSKQRGELLDAREVAAAWSHEGMMLRNYLLQLPARLAPELVGLGDLRAIEDQLRDKIHNALGALAGGEHTPGWPGRAKQDRAA